MEAEQQFLYRYERGWDSEYDTNISLHEFPIVRTTPKGYWIRCWHGEKFVLKEGKKRYAYPTADEAYLNFRKRTEMCISILEGMVEKSYRFLKAERPTKARRYNN